jgi:hypothetical protein
MAQRTLRRTLRHAVLLAALVACARAFSTYPGSCDGCAQRAACLLRVA